MTEQGAEAGGRKAEHRSVVELYEARRAGRIDERERRNRVAELLAWARLVVFVSTAVVGWQALSDGASGLLMALAGVLAAAFLLLARWHGREKRRVEWLGALAAVSAEATNRVLRAWHALPVVEWRDVDADHPYAVDLDLFGPASVSQLLPRVSGAPGREILRGWLLEPAPPDEIRERQAAVAELTPRLEFRDALTALGRRIWLGPEKMARLEQWAAGDPWLVRRPALVAVGVLLPAATLALGLGQLGGVLASSLWVAPLTASLLLSGVYGAPLRRTLAPVADQSDALAGYAEMTRLVSGEAFESPLLRRLQADMARGDQPAHRALRSLRMLADCSQVRSSPMLHMALQAILLWDFHVVHLVERWQRTHGRHLPAWLAALGRVEGIAALAGLAHGNPGWTFPEIDGDATALDARALGHPLLAEDVRVANDVTVGPPGTLLLVTGSNMSGKSTLLRAVGVNVVLAQAGAPVCAASLRCPPVAVHTSMRIRDSLERGVSYFMAEVLRLRQVVDATRKHGGSSPRVLYVFDEILQGTNAAERTVAAQRIVEFLLSADAIGALATHDLRLLEAESVARAARLVHFREDVAEGRDGRPTLHFDYRLRPGPASTTNALKLMELAGLPVT